MTHSRKAIILTERQEDALYCFGEGMTIRKTAEMMLISEYTARWYSSQLRAIFNLPPGSQCRDLVPCARRYFRVARSRA